MVSRRPAIQVPRRLVADDERRLPDERPRKGDPLAFAARQLGRPMVQAVLQPDLLQQRPRAVGDRRIRRIDQRRHQHVLQHRALRQQEMVLEDEADPASSERRPAACSSSANGSAPSRVTFPPVGGSSPPTM